METAVNCEAKETKETKAEIAVEAAAETTETTETAVTTETTEPAETAAALEAKEAAAPAKSAGETAPAKAEEPLEKMEDFKDELEASFRKISEGDIIKGTIVAVTDDEVILDLNYYAQGVIKAGEYSRTPGFSLKTDVEIGAEVEAMVMKLDDGQGNIGLSKVEANKVLAWEKLEKLRAEETTLSVKISGIAKGGVIAYLEDMRGFIPASQLSLEYVEDLNVYLHKMIDVRVITVDQKKDKLVMSAKTLLREEAKASKERKAAALVPGTIMEGTVEGIKDFGAFVGLGEGLTGLVHISQLAEGRVKNVSEVVNVGDKVKVKVQKVADGKISLTMKGIDAEAKAEKIDDYQYKSEGKLTTSLGGLLANIKL